MKHAKTLKRRDLEDELPIQYVVLRSDLPKEFTAGSAAAQAVHAAVSCLFSRLQDEEVQKYLEHGEEMRTVVLQADGPGLERLESELLSLGQVHRAWIEQPEGIKTALAVSPFYRSAASPRLREALARLKLYK